MIHLLEEIPVYIVKTKELGLIGCFVINLKIS